MSSKDEHRYLFTVRQAFGQEPVVDTFYKLRVPDGLTGDQAQVMTKLNKNWCKDEIASDTRALSGMQLRLRFNSDSFPHVCLVRSQVEITAEELDSILASKHERNTLMNWLEGAALK